MKSLAAFVSVAVLFTGCVHSPEPAFHRQLNRVENFALRTSGDPGQAFTAKLKLDGEERIISGASPAKYSLSACVLTGTITRTGGNGALSFEIVADDALVAFARRTNRVNHAGSATMLGPLKSGDEPPAHGSVTFECLL